MMELNQTKQRLSGHSNSNLHAHRNEKDQRDKSRKFVGHQVKLEIDLDTRDRVKLVSPLASGALDGSYKKNDNKKRPSSSKKYAMMALISKNVGISSQKPSTTASPTRPNHIIKKATIKKPSTKEVINKLDDIAQDTDLVSKRSCQKPTKEMPKVTTAMKKSVSAIEKARNKLKSARFRHLNEQLYTTTGDQAQKLFKKDPEAFHIYHHGFKQQLSRWPVDPLDTIVGQLKEMPKSTKIADFGCGDARLAESLPQFKVFSFDLVATKPCVTACNIARVPLKKKSVDVVVLCLALMGTDLSKSLCEANRVLQKGGTVKIAEVMSRFYSLSRFIKNVESLGFSLQHKESLGKMFQLLTFRKIKDTTDRHCPDIQLKPCLYKRR